MIESLESQRYVWKKKFEMVDELVPLPSHSAEWFVRVCTLVSRRHSTLVSIVVELHPHARAYDFTKLSLYDGFLARNGALPGISMFSPSRDSERLTILEYSSSRLI